MSFNHIGNGLNQRGAGVSDGLNPGDGLVVALIRPIARWLAHVVTVVRARVLT